MTPMQQFYLDRAAEAGRTAAAAPLANVRERHLLAELTWNGLAARAGRVARVQAEPVRAALAAPL
ncbi:MAG: hypothetical protein ACK4K7_02180 [Allosphingosinicella sp.]|uniref:hypothetical protein n=1 Tax=Allosphingosinicella sp. TaxID=2823234 RepID=UPI00392FB78D